MRAAHRGLPCCFYSHLEGHILSRHLTIDSIVEGSTPKYRSVLVRHPHFDAVYNSRYAGEVAIATSPHCRIVSQDKLSSSIQEKSSTPQMLDLEYPEVYGFFPTAGRSV